MTRGLFIIGTDTGVGKTLITASLSWKLSKKYNISVMKPFATGNKIFSKEYNSKDLAIISKSINLQEKQSLLNPSYYNLPSSPYMAYKLLNSRPPNLNLILKNINYLKNKYDLVLVEGIGGLMVPLNRKYTLLNFIKKTKLDVIIITTPRLGTLNHTLLTVKICELNSINVKGLIVNKMPSNPNIVELNTPRFLHELTNIPIIGTVPNLKNFRIGKKIFKSISDLIDIDSIF